MLILFRSFRFVFTFSLADSCETLILQAVLIRHSLRMLYHITDRQADWRSASLGVLPIHQLGGFAIRFTFDLGQRFCHRPRLRSARLVFFLFFCVYFVVCAYFLNTYFCLFVAVVCCCIVKIILESILRSIVLCHVFFHLLLFICCIRHMTNHR